jgi:glyoxylase-like metal-dependent hydrolase (beta-lactamase superfamily II)/rhodanese-related sulfurtransferase
VILAVLDTHNHADHESIRPLLQKMLADRLHDQNSKFDTLGWPTHTSSSLVHVKLETGQEVPALLLHSSEKGNFVLARLESPGHTEDSLTFIYGVSENGVLKKNAILSAFCGDTILSGGLGRTNFSVSQPEALFDTLRTLQDVLSPNSLLCPAHDYNNSFATHLQIETAENPLLNLALGPQTPLSKDLFLQRKKEIDLELSKIEENFQGVVCGVTPTGQKSCDGNISIAVGQLHTYLKQCSQEPLIIDVRESQEFALFKDWEIVGLKQPPKNVPLSRLVNFMCELVTAQKFNQELLLICRTGNRSLQVAKSLRRLGFHKAWNLEGGVALSSGNSQIA